MSLRHFDALFPIRAALGARVGFAGRFDRVARRSVNGGGGVSPASADHAFGSALRLWIHPGQLESRLIDRLPGPAGRRTEAMFLLGGDWDGLIFPLARSRIHVELIQLCAAGGDYRATSRYRALARQISEGSTVRRGGVLIGDTEGLDRYFDDCVSLMDAIRQHGLLPRRDLASAARPTLHLRRPLQDRLERDVGVAVGRTGRLVHHGNGRHRVAIAKGLGLTRIPVEVRLVHPRWLLDASQTLARPPHQALPAALASQSARWLTDGAASDV